jgi:hypothetical protein
MLAPNPTVANLAKPFYRNIDQSGLNQNDTNADIGK